MSMPSGANTSIILRLELNKETASFGGIATAISDTGGDIVAIDVVRTERNSTTRDITINVYDQKHTDLIVETIKRLNGVRVVHVSDQTFLLHLGGKIEMNPKYPIKNRDDLSRVYTPGVARVCTAIHEKPSLAHTLTIKRNTVAVVSWLCGSRTWQYWA
jgi:malate dehydrogenase (oxaloacetate-decarboxylating)